MNLEVFVFDNRTTFSSYWTGFQRVKLGENSGRSSGPLAPYPDETQTFFGGLSRTLCIESRKGDDGLSRTSYIESRRGDLDGEERGEWGFSNGRVLWHGSLVGSSSSTHTNSPVPSIVSGKHNRRVNSPVPVSVGRREYVEVQRDPLRVVRVIVLVLVLRPRKVETHNERH